MEANMKIAVILSAYDRMSDVVSKAVNASQSKLKSFEDRAGKLADKSFKAGQEMVASGLAVGAPLYDAIQQATEFETKMVDIRKQMVNDTPAAVAAMTKEVNKLGRELPLATGDLQEMISAGLRMGIAQDKIVNYTKDVTKMSVAFDISAGEIADSMGKISGVYNIPIEKIGDFADAINYLDDKTKTKGADLVNVLTRIGGAVSKLKPNQAAALASTFLTLGESPETAGSAITNFMTVLSAADARSRKTKQAFMELGLAPAQVQRDMITNAQGTIDDVFSRIGKLAPDQQTSMISKLFGNEHISKMQKLANNLEEYHTQLKLVQGKEKGSMDAEYQKRITSSAARMQIFKNKLSALAVTAGTVLLPALNQFLAKVGGLLEKVGAFAQKHETLVKTLLMGAAAFSALALAGGYLSFVIGGVARLFVVFSNVAGIVTKGVQLIGTAWKILNALFTTNVIILAIMAIALGVFLVIKYWDKIKWFFAGLWRVVKAIFMLALAAITYVILNFTPAGLIFKHWDKLKPYFVAVWNGAKKPFVEMYEFVMAMGKFFYRAGANIINSIIKGIKSGVKEAVKAIEGVTQRIRNHLPFSPAKEGPLRDIHRIKLVETIAGTIKAGPMVRAMRTAIGGLASTGGNGGAMSHGGMNVTIAPVIHLSGGATQKDATTIAGTIKQQVLQVMRDEEKRKQRVSF